MEQVIERCAGLDVHKATVAAWVRTPGNRTHAPPRSPHFRHEYG
jgi:hypothetical protein